MQDGRLVDRAKRLRQQLTPFEARLWSRLNRSQLGHKFRRQHVIDSAIVDFFCPAKALIVEVDGDTHDEARDRSRDARHNALGYVTLRFTNSEVRWNVEGVLQRIADTLATLPDRWPHPSIPSRQGEGR
jgi:very-short-patch-repair endonuclease